MRDTTRLKENIGFIIKMNLKVKYKKRLNKVCLQYDFKIKSLTNRAGSFRLSG